MFRTNALNANYEGASTWVSVVTPVTNPYYPDGSTDPFAAAYDYSADVALYK